MGGVFQVQYVSVDGAGRYPDVFDDAAAAVRFADEKQTLSNTRTVNGWVNPWRYRYFVRDARGRVVYRTVAVHSGRC